MRVVPPHMLDALHVRFLRGALPRLAMHPSANFVVQSYLAALRTSQQVRCHSCHKLLASLYSRNSWHSLSHVIVLSPLITS
jgi:hypothetical protein